jgi:hypothetical protein
MVEEARELHTRSVSAAGEYDDGTCAYCDPERHDDPPPLLFRRRDYLNGMRSKVWMHFHEDRHPYCSTCAAGYDGRADWPCATAAALGVSS